MPLSVSAIKTEFRSRIGDNDSSNYFMSDTQLESNITKAGRRLNMYVRNIGEDASLTADGGASYAIPAGIHPDAVVKVGYRTGTDITTDVVINQVDWVAGKLRLPSTVGSGYIIFIQYRKAFTIGTDELPDYVAEILYDLLAVFWYDLALARRADFEQWASTTDSDSRISEIAQARREAASTLADLANSLGNTMRVSDLGGGA
jgi:hypothetical protein